jgi:hypothetical protein
MNEQEITRFDIPKEVEIFINKAIEIQLIVDWKDVLCLGIAYKNDWLSICHKVCEWAYINRCWMKEAQHIMYPLMTAVSQALATK